MQERQDEGINGKCSSLGGRRRDRGTQGTRRPQRTREKAAGGRKEPPHILLTGLVHGASWLLLLLPQFAVWRWTTWRACRERWRRWPPLSPPWRCGRRRRPCRYAGYRTAYAGSAVTHTSRLRRCLLLSGASQPTPPPNPAPNPFRNDYKNSDYCGFSPTGCGELAQQLLPMELYGRNDPIPLAILVTVNGTTNTTTEIASYYPKVDQFTLLDIPNSALSGRGCAEPTRALTQYVAVRSSSPIPRWTAGNFSLTRSPRVALGVVTRNGIVLLPARRWSMGNKVIGFRSVVITLDHGRHRSRRRHCVRAWAHRCCQNEFARRHVGRKPERHPVGRRPGLRRRVRCERLHRQRVRRHADAQHCQLRHRLRYQGARPH